MLKNLNNTDYDTIEADSVQALQFFENTQVDHSVCIQFDLYTEMIITIFIHKYS